MTQTGRLPKKPRHDSPQTQSARPTPASEISPVTPHTFLQRERQAARGRWVRKTVRAINAHPTAVQRYADLNAMYGARNVGLEAEEKTAWLGKFTQIQLLLNDGEKVKRHLTALAAFMGRHGLSLDQALRNHESGIWTSAQPILTDFVPAPMFEDFVSRGQLFVDLVGKSHGVQTHRIQWFLIRAEFGSEFVNEVYPESVNPRWKIGDKNMWDRIVDETGARDGDFTMPDKLEAYLVEQFESLCSRSDMGKLVGQVHEGHESQREDKAAMQQRYPPESEYTDVLQQAMERHRQLRQEEAALNQVAGDDFDKARYDEVKEEQLEVEASIVKERITHRSGGGIGALLGGMPARTYTWTGWIPATSSQAKQADTYFIPTVAYPQGADPDETTMGDN